MGDRGLRDLLHPMEVRREARDDEALVGYSRNSARIATPTVDSDGVNPGRSAFVESESSSRTPPSRRAISPSSARSVRRPSTGVRSSLKSPVCTIVPAGVKNAIAKPCGTEWVTGMNWQSNGADPAAFAVVHRDQLGAVEHARFLDAVAGQRERQLRAVDRHLDVAEQEREPARVVLVGVGEEHALDPVRVVAQIREVGEDEVDAGHVGVGEHEPAVDHEDAVVDLEAEAVAPDLAQPAEENDPNA